MSVLTGMENVDLPVEVLILNAKEIAACLTYKDVVEAQDASWKAYGNGEFQMQLVPPACIGPAKDGNWFKGHPSYLTKMGPKGKLGTFGEKWGALFQTPMSGMPRIWGAVVILNQGDNGQPFAILEGTSITNIRTGAHSAVAAKYLAKKGSHTLAMIGCGAEARTHLGVYNEIFPLKAVKVFDIKPEAMEKFTKEMSDLFRLKVIPTSSAKEAVEGTDIILLVTTALKPVLMEPWIPAGSFVSSVLSFRDLDPVLSTKADKWVIGWPPHDEGFLRHLGFNDEFISHIYADMGEIATGKKPGRQNDRERIVYTHMGAGIHDIALGIVAYNNAVKRGMGTKIRLA